MRWVYLDHLVSHESQHQKAPQQNMNHRDEMIDDVLPKLKNDKYPLLNLILL